MYNDQPPPHSEAPSTFGHSKGVAAVGSRKGFWLVHSTPHFPAPQSGSYSFPDSEKDYGQSFLCLSLDTYTMNTVGNAFILNRPYVYSSNLPSAISASVPSFAAVLNGHFNTSTPQANAVTMSTSGRNTFTVFSRNARWNADLYANLVEPVLKTGLLVESWMNGPTDNKMPTFCAGSQYNYSSINIRNVGFSGSCADWPETKDHSKWAIATGSTKIFCIGDSNRQFSQAKRGGGTVCASNTNIYNSFQSIIASSDSCP